MSGLRHCKPYMHLGKTRIYLEYSFISEVKGALLFLFLHSRLVLNVGFMETSTLHQFCTKIIHDVE